MKDKEDSLLELEDSGTEMELTNGNKVYIIIIYAIAVPTGAGSL